ncbi:hypothetical protein EJ110_NYTH46898 [Nymphaea thermarum]|nr:hypothetical protein EJ110_NYTH46898 [Nymphaea thermarum]
MATRLLRDIHLLENQIPGLVLDALINVGDWTGFRKPESGSKLSFGTLHFLDLQRKSLLGNPPAPVKEQRRCRLLNLLGPRRRTQPKTFPSSSQQADKQSTSNMDFALEFLPKREKYVRSATKLRAAGVSFQKCPKDAGLLSVRFRRSCLRGVLHLPELVLDETTEGVFMNMVAFERMHPESGTEVTSFLSFMDALIDTADDVSFLSNEGIVKNSLGSDKAAAMGCVTPLMRSSRRCRNMHPLICKNGGRILSGPTSPAPGPFCLLLAPCSSY